MALSGSLNIISTQETGNILTRSFTVPADVSEDDPYYAQKGTTVEGYYTESIIVSSSYTNSYVKLRQANMWVNMEEGTDTGSFNLECQYRVYGSEVSKSADLNNYLLERTINTTWDIDTDSNIFTKSYSTLKNELGADTLTDV